MRTRNVLKFRPSFETLEGRLTPAGNVTAVFTAATATLTLTGDALANGVDVSAGAGGLGSIAVIGTVDGTATTVNGSALAQTFNGVKNLVVNLNGGNDSLSFGFNTAGTIILQGNLTINTGTGNDTIITAGGGNFLDVFGNLGVTNGAGTYDTTLTDVNVVGSATFNHTAGGSSFLVINTSTATDNSWKTLTITNGTGNDLQQINDTNFSGAVSINNGASTLVGGSSQTRMRAVNSTTLLKVGGNLTITFTSGDFTAPFIDDYNINGNLTTNSGNGTPVGFFLEETPGLPGLSPTIKGNVSATLGGGNPFVRIGGAGTPLVINGGLTLNMSAQTGGATVQLNDLASVGNSSLTGGISITTGTGNDTLSIDNTGSGSTFNGNLSIKTGNGNDTLQINGAGAAPTFFFGTVNVDQGAGNDSLELGNTGPVNFFKSATFSGGSAVNDINNTILEVFANTTGGPVVPTLIHYHP
jgi:hypothetical protein